MSPRPDGSTPAVTVCESEATAKRQRAEAWVNRYAAHVATEPWRPGTTAPTFRAHGCSLCRAIGRIYRGESAAADAARTSAALGLANIADRLAVVPAVQLGPRGGPAHAAAVAGAIHAMGRRVVHHFETAGR